MKNLKKVLALVLAFACAFTMFAGAVVYPDVPAGSEYSEAITMLSDLGIIQGKDDGKYHSEDTITRAEACALIARMLTGDPQVSQYAGASNFTDVVKGSWKESVVGYCVVNGITVGVGNNKFEPDRAITDAEFVTMVVRAMGYETTGTSYPYGHISAAQANGLLDDVTVIPSSPAERGEDAQIIYNALFADYARGAKQINTTHGTTVEEYPTIAEDVFGLKRAAVGESTKDGELKNCKAHTWVIDEVVKKDDGTSELWAAAIEDDETTLYKFDNKAVWAVFNYEGSSAEDLKGYQVELWGEGQHGEEEYETREMVDENGKVVKTKVVAYDWDIKAVKTVKGQTAYDYNPTMADSKTDGTLKFDDNELDVDSKNYTDDKKGYEDYLNTKNSSQFKLIDWDSDDQVDYIVEDYTYYAKVVSVTSKKLKVADFDGDTYTLDLDGDAVDYEIVDGITLKGDLPADLEKDDIISITGDTVWNKKVTEATVTLTIEVVEPETKELTDVDSKDKAWFDDEKIEVADNGFNFTNDETGEWYRGLNEKNEDTEYDLYRDANGYIIFAEEAESVSKGYIFVTGIEEGANKTGDRNLMVVSGRLDDNSKLEDAKIAKDAKIYVESYKADGKRVDIQDDNEFITGKSGKDVIGHAFKYSVNDNDEITKLDEVACDVPADETDAYEFYDNNDSVVAKNQTRVWLDDCKVIFAVRKFGTNADVNHINTLSAGVYDDIDLDDVMAVQVEDLPDIGGNDDKTDSWGIRYSKPNNKARVETVVLGVNTFRYFASSTTKAALVTYVKYNSKTDKYTVTASIPGKEGTSFTTIDRDDLSLTGTTQMDLLQTELKSSGTQHAIFCEVEFNKDGEISEIVRMDKDVNAYTNGIATVADNCSYTASRVVVDHVANKSSDNYLTVMEAVSAGKKIYTRATGAGLTATWKFADDAEFYVLGEDVKLGTDGATLNAYKDAFSDKFDIDDIEEASKSDLVSFVNNDTDDDEYVVADIVRNDDGKIVAVYYYEEPVEEQAGTYVPTLGLKKDTAKSEKLTFGVDSAVDNSVVIRYETMDGDTNIAAITAGAPEVTIKQGETDVTALFAISQGANGKAFGIRWKNGTEVAKPGTYTVEVKAENYNAATATFEVVKAEPTLTVAATIVAATKYPNTVTVSTGLTNAVLKAGGADKNSVKVYKEFSSTNFYGETVKEWKEVQVSNVTLSNGTYTFTCTHTVAAGDKYKAVFVENDCIASAESQVFTVA